MYAPPGAWPFTPCITLPRATSGPPLKPKPLPGSVIAMRHPYRPNFSRRRILQGLGVTGAVAPFVPLLESGAAGSEAPPRRLLLFFSPHGTVREHWYHSKALGVRRSLHVYTPPGYDKSRKDFPVMYLLHGSGDNDATWTALGRAHVIIDNLLAQKKAQPMIVVMTDGHAAFSQPSTNAEARARNTKAFESDLLGDVMPFVEENYRTINKRESRAIIGLSMGGGQSLAIGLNHPELFAWLGAMSASTPEESSVAKALAEPDAMNKKLKLFWIAIGKDDFLLNRNEQFNRLLTSKGIKHIYEITEGNHSWPVWRRYLADFAPLLFLEKKSK